MLALGHIGYRKHYTAYSKRSSDCQDFHQKSLSPPFFLSSHPKNSEFWHQERKTLSWIQRGNMLFEKCMLCVLERQTRSFLAFKGKITLALLSYCLGSLAVQQLPLPAGNNSSQGAFFLIHQFVSFSDKIMPLYSMMPPININYAATTVTFSVIVWIRKSPRSLMPLLPQLVSPAFSPLYDERPGWPPTSSPASSSTTPTGLLNFQQPGVCSRMAAHTMSPPSVAASHFTHPHRQLQILIPFRWFLSQLCSGHFPNHSASHNGNDAK